MNLFRNDASLLRVVLEMTPAVLCSLSVALAVPTRSLAEDTVWTWAVMMNYAESYGSSNYESMECPRFSSLSWFRVPGCATLLFQARTDGRS